MKKIYLLLSLLIVTYLGKAQIYQMNTYNGQTVSTCKGQVTSSSPGGFVGYSNGYANNEDYTVTFCSSAGSKLRANFYWVSLETNYDWLKIYDGPSTASTLLATLTGESLYPGVFTSSGTCLTFQFHSDGSTRWGGFNALLGCTPTACGTNSIATDDCGSAPTICNLNGYCGNTSGWFTRDNGGIEGTTYGGTGVFSCGSIQNNSWLSFIASATTASFQITSSSCATNTSGIQAIVLSTTNCTSFSSVSNCVSQGAPGTSTLNATGLTVGTKYYIMVDGVDGNDCRYDVVAQSGVQTVSISPSSSSACSGSNVTMTAVATGTGPFTYTWSPSPSSGQGTTTAVYTVPASTTTYSCTIGGACGSSQVATYTLTPSNVSVTASSTSATLCSGGSTTLSASGTGPAANYTFTNTTDYTIPVTASSTTVVTSPITVSGLSGTVGTSLLNVNVNIGHTYDSDLLIQLQCPNGTIINLSNQNGTSGDNYTNTTFQTGAAAITSGSPPFNGTYAPEQAFSGLSGCNINGTWNLIITDEYGPADGGTLYDWTITFVSSSLTYSWSPGTGLSSTSGSPVTASPTSTTVYTVTATAGNGCSNTNTVTVNVNPKPTMTSASSAAICSGAAVSIPLTASAASSFSWIATNNPNTTGESTTAQSSSTINNTISLNGGITTPQTVTYTVTPTSTAGSCAGTPQTVSVTVNPVPTISAMSNITTGCVGSTVSVPNYTVTPASTINWSVSPAGSGLAASGSGNIGSFTASAAGTYTVSASATATSGGCSTSSPTVFTITINNKPTVTATSTTVCSGQSATITAGGASTYTWSTSGTGSSLTVNPATATATYTVTGTAATTCTNTATGTITVNALPAVTATSATVCSGASATLTAGGASTYTWNPGGSSGSNLTINPATSSNTYTVTGTDGNGCTKTATGALTVNPLPTVSSTTNSQTVCAGSTVNTISFSTSPASGVTVNWTNSNTAVGIAGSGSGNITSYTAPNVGTQTTGVISAVVTNSSTGCSSASAPLTGTITINPKPTVVSTSTTVCNGASATITASGASTYNWNTGASGSGLTVSPATATTSYTVTGTDANSCTNTATGTITVNALPTVASTSTTVCSGQNATITASGATTYTWSTAATGTNLNVTNPPVGTNSYTVTGTDGNNCTNTATGTITVNPLPTVTSASSSQTVCAGGTVNGITFGTNPATGVTVDWTNTNAAIGLVTSGSGNITGWTAPNVGSQTQGVISAVATITGTGCSNSSTATGTVTINPNPTITTPSTPTNPSACGTSDGALNGLVVTGAAPVTYSWNSGAYSGANISGLGAGSYNVLATDGNGCTVNTSYSLSDPVTPPAPTFAISPGTICEGTSIFLNVINPQPGETYNWFGPSGPLGTADTIFINNATLADAGTYSVSTTAAGCTGNASPSQTLTVNPNPTADITSNSFSICRDSQTVIDGSASTGGGTATVTGYQWIQNGSVISGATSATYTVNQAGTYQLAIVNSNGCVDTTAEVPVNLFSEPDFSTTAPNSTNSNCTSPTGSIGDVNPASLSGGTSDYTYSWYGSGGLITSTTSISTDAPALTGQPAGTYTLIVVDNNGCNDTLTASIVNDNAPVAPAISGGNPANCSGSGNAPITMTSSGTLTWYSDPALTNVLGFGSPFTPASTQTDTLYVVDSLNGCSSAATQVIITVINTPTEPSVTSVSVCQGDPVPDLQASYSGNGSIFWYSDPGLTTQVGSGTTFASGVTSGTVIFYAAAIDSVCSSQAVPAAVAINNLPDIHLENLLVDSASCDGTNNGNLTGISIQGNPSYVYVWSNAGGVVDSTGTTPDLTNAAAGTYTLTVTDANGCVSSEGPIEIYSYSTPNTPTLDVAASTTTYCAGDPVGAVTANANNGNLVWYADAGMTTQIGAGNTITPTGVTTDTVLYVVANNNNCVSAALQVPITFNPLPTVSGNDATTCDGGQVTLNGAGATTYTWDNNVTDGVPFTPTASGTYQVTGTDQNGCVNSATVAVTVNSLPNVTSASGPTASTCDDGTSTITLSGSGANTYTWDNGVVDGVPFIPTNGGNYVVTGTDGNGCQNTFTVSVSLNPLPTVTVAAAIDSMPCGSTNYDVAAVSTNASSPVYSWSGPNVVANGNTASPTVGAAGTYVVMVTDGATGCSASSSVNIIDATVIASFTPDVTSGFTPLGVNFTNNSINATTYTWTFGDGNTSTAVNPSNTYTLNGTFTVTLTAYSNGCQDDTTAVITIEANSSIVIPNIFSPNGDGVNDVLTITSTGIKELSIDIFNRWGQRVYLITAPGQNWDGTLDNGNSASEGTYFYLLKAIGYDQKEYEAQGPIMLVK